MKVFSFTLFSFLVSSVVFSQSETELFNVSDISQASEAPAEMSEEQLYTEINDFKLFIKLPEGYEEEEYKGFRCFENKERDSRVQYMTLEMGEDLARERVESLVNNSEESKVVYEELIDLDGEDSYLYMVLNAQEGEERIEFYLITSYKDGTLLFKGSSPEKEDAVEEIREMMLSLKRGF